MCYIVKATVRPYKDKTTKTIVIPKGRTITELDTFDDFMKSIVDTAQTRGKGWMYELASVDEENQTVEFKAILTQNSDTEE